MDKNSCFASVCVWQTRSEDYSWIFQWPGSGDYFHNLHHKHFDCNYGAMHVPMDYWFGTYAGGKEDIAKIWHGQKAGEDANETEVHDEAKKQK